MNFSAPSLSTPSFGAPSMPSMPSAPENPLSDAQMEEIKTECKEFLDKFGKAYLASYKASLIAKVKEDLKGTEPSPFKLKTAPDHAEPEVVMSGFLTKRGEVFKNWKKRVFVLKSNGGCQYFVKEGDSKAKGAIGLEGYSVNAEPTTDIFSGKQFVFTLEHSDEEKRVWYLFADGEEEKQEWVLAFKQACRVAEGYVNPDKIVRGAFASAYAKLRRAYGMWPKKPRGPEQEALTDVLYERVYDKILRDALRNVDGIPKKLAIKAAKVSVTAAVTAAWKGFDQATDKIRPGIEGTLKKAMGPFVEGEQRVKTKIQESVGEKVINPIVERSLVPFFQQVVSILYPVIVEALSLQLSISIDACKQAGGDLKDSQNASQVFKGLKKTLDIKPALKKLPMKNISQWEKNVDQILAVVGKLDSVGNFASSLKTDINDNIKPAVHTIFPGSIEESMLGLVKNTLYTFEEDFKESNGPDAANRTLSKLNYDLSLIFEQIVQDSLKELVSGPFEEQVQGPADELIAPIADEIPEDLKDFIDPQALLDDVLDQTLDDAISTATGPGVSKLTEQLNTTLTSKGIELLSVSD